MAARTKKAATDTNTFTPTEVQIEVLKAFEHDWQKQSEEANNRMLAYNRQISKLHAECELGEDFGFDPQTYTFVKRDAPGSPDDADSGVPDEESA